MFKLRYTYFFWAIFSLYNIGFLFPLAFPPLIIIFGVFYLEFSNFLLPVLICSGFITGFAVYLVKKANLKTNTTTAILYTLLINVIFLLSFLTCAEGYKNHLINKALENHNPKCVQINSFFSSLEHGGHDNQFKAHAIFVEDDKTFFWSYSKLDFFEGRDELSRNFPCMSSK